MPKYQIEFHEMTITPTADYPSAFAALAALANDNGQLSINVGGHVRELWKLDTSTRHVIKGSFRKFRMSDLPEIGSVGGASVELELEENQGLVEKNFFALYKQHALLVWHTNGNANTPMQFGRTLSQLLETKVNVNPIIQGDALRRLMSGAVELRKIELSIPRPRNPEYFPEDEFNQALFSALAGAEGDRIQVTITTDARTNGHGKLKHTVKRAIKELVTDDAVSVARADVDDDGIKHPIDLIADRLRSYQDIDHDGRYPQAGEMFRAFDDARREEREAINAYFQGQDGAAIR